jgi:hypothetical protein
MAREENMANGLYEHGRENFALGAIHWASDDIRLAFIDEGDDAIDLANDEDMGDRLSASVVAESGNFATKSALAGVCDAADITVSTVTGDQFESIDIFKHSGTGAANDLLICNIDTATGLPFTPSGGDIEVQWDAGANKIFKL